MATVRKNLEGAGARVRFARFARSLALSGPPMQTYKLVGSGRSGDKNRWNEEDLKFRSRTISRNNITQTHRG